MHNLIINSRFGSKHVGVQSVVCATSNELHKASKGPFLPAALVTVIVAQLHRCGDGEAPAFTRVTSSHEAAPDCRYHRSSDGTCQVGIARCRSPIWMNPRQYHLERPRVSFLRDVTSMRMIPALSVKRGCLYWRAYLYTALIKPTPGLSGRYAL